MERFIASNGTGHARVSENLSEQQIRHHSSRFSGHRRGAAGSEIQEVSRPRKAPSQEGPQEIPVVGQALGKTQSGQ